MTAAQGSAHGTGAGVTGVLFPQAAEPGAGAFPVVFFEQLRPALRGSDIGVHVAEKDLFSVLPPQKHDGQARGHVGTS
jgi:hypothetical protein